MLDGCNNLHHDAYHVEVMKDNHGDFMSLDMSGGRGVEHSEPSARSTKTRGRKVPKKNSQGQNGPKLSLSWEKLTTNERRVIKSLLPSPGEHRKPMSISEIAAETGWAKRMSQAKANSWVRNQLRRLVRADYVEHAEKIKDGNYILTDYGKRQARAHIEQKTTEPETKQEVPTPAEVIEQATKTEATTPVSF